MVEVATDPRAPGHTKDLGIIGGGAKAVAIVVKWAAIRATHPELRLPRIWIVEPHAIGAAWTGKAGYTNGKLRLCTPPEYDLGFPYSPGSTYGATDECDSEQKGAYGTEVYEYLFKHFSWPAYRVAVESKRLMGEGYEETVHRGAVGSSPTHVEFAEYLNWAFDKAMDIAKGAVTLRKPYRFCGMQTSNERLHISLTRVADHASVADENPQAPQEDMGLLLDGLVVTGPGPAKQPAYLPKSTLIFDGQNVWEDSHWDRLLDIVGPARMGSKSEANYYDGKIDVGIIGSGETAATIAKAIAQAVPEAKFVIVNRSPALFSRGEGFSVERLFTDTSGPQEKRWVELAPKKRREYIRRLDRGVISPCSLRQLGEVSGLQHKQIEVEVVSVDEQAGLVKIHPNDSEAKSPQKNGSKTEPIQCRVLINCAGFDAWWFLNDCQIESLRDARRAWNTLKVSTERDQRKTAAMALEEVEEKIQIDLSLQLDPESDWPKLHLPMLAGPAQGPGLPNLTCLGNLSDRILRPYIQAPLTAHPNTPTLNSST